MKRTRVFVWIYILLVLALPVAALFASFPSISQSIKDIFLSGSFVKSIKNSVIIGLSTTILAGFVGTTAAFFVSKTSIPFKGTLTALLTLPVFFVPYQFALAWSSLLPPGRLSNFLFSSAGVVFVLTGCFYPIVFWLSLAGFSSIPPEEEESGLLIAPPSRVLFSITLPRVIPSILTASLLVFLLSFSELGVATYLGINVISTEVLLQFSAFYNLNAAIAASFPMLALGILIFVLESRFLKKGIKFYQRSTEGEGLTFSSGSFKPLALTFLALVILLFLLLPFAELVYEASDLSSLSIALKHGIGSLVRSTFYSLSAGLIGAIWAILAVLSKSTINASSSLSLLTFLLPPPVIAIGLIYTWSKSPLSSLVYGTVALLLLGLLVRFSFISYKVMETSMENIDPSVQEAAIVCGASSFTVFKKIIFPQVKKWFLLAVMLVFIFSMNELGVSTMLYPPGGEPLVVRLYTLSVNNPIGVSSALALMNSFITLLLVIVFIWRGKLK